MRKLFFCLLCLVTISGCSITNHHSHIKVPEGIQWVETEHAQPGEASIPYSKYRLDNGLTVILSPDHSDPLVHVDVSYHVGSARETKGKTGFAHFFEHMMFQGSAHVGDQEHSRLITEAGGSMNGSTNRDRTTYYETVPANQLEKVLWLESDRMGFLLDAVSQRKFEIQRDTVKNERAQNYDNRPYGLIWEKMGEAMFPSDHPYSWQTIGYVKDLDPVDVNDLKAFFLRWYGPNNAVLTIGGDIDEQKTLAWVQKYFGTIPAGPEVHKPEKRPAKLNYDRFITMEDRIQQPMVVIGWPAEYMGAESQTSLDVLAQVLGSGSNSLLYQSLVKTQKAISAGAFQDCGELACTFYIYAIGGSKEKKQLNNLYHDLLAVVNKLGETGVVPERLDEIKGMSRADAIFALQSVDGKVTQLASNQIFFGKPDRMKEEIQEIEAVSPQSVENVLKQFVLGHHKVILSVVPRGKTDLAVQKASFSAPEHQSAPHHPIKDKDLHYRQVKDNFDRSVMPDVAAPVKSRLPSLYSHYFDNGIEVMGTETTETPTVLVTIRLPAGNRYVLPGKEGLAELTASLMEEGTTKRRSEALESALDKLGSSVSVSAGGYTTNINVSALTENLAPTLAILNEVLLHPRFDKKDFARIKNQMIQGTVYQHQKLSWLASQATRQVLFGDSVFSRVDNGTQASIAGLTLQDVKDFYKQHYTPLGAQVVVVGNLSERDAVRSLSFLSQWKGSEAPLLAPQYIPPVNHRKIYVVDKPGASQSIVRFVRQGMPFDATGEVFLTALTNFNLAGNFNSRMNQNLREDKGYTYGMTGYLSANREVGAIIFSAPVRKNATLGAIREMTKEMKNFVHTGLSEQEMKFMRFAVGQQDALAYETPSQKAGLIGDIMTYSLDNDYLQQRNRIVSSVSRHALNQLAKKWFNPDDYQIIVVGDMKVLKPQLEKLNLPVEELDIIH